MIVMVIHLPYLAISTCRMEETRTSSRLLVKYGFNDFCVDRLLNRMLNIRSCIVL
jgi:hypothetical protein